MVGTFVILQITDNTDGLGDSSHEHKTSHLKYPKIQSCLSSSFLEGLLTFKTGTAHHLPPANFEEADIVKEECNLKSLLDTFGVGGDASTLRR